MTYNWIKLAIFYIFIHALVALAGCASLSGIINQDPQNQNTTHTKKQEDDGANSASDEQTKSSPQESPPAPDDSGGPLSGSLENEERLQEKDSQLDGGKSAGANTSLNDNEEDSTDGAEGRDDKGFKRFDHSQYVVDLTKAARELVGENEGIFLARLCKYRTTGDRSLLLYTRKGKKFSYIDYRWDPIDAKWIETPPSPSRPMAMFRDHLRASSADRDCKILKGRIP